MFCYRKPKLILKSQTPLECSRCSGCWKPAIVHRRNCQEPLNPELKEVQQLSVATFGTTAQDPRGGGYGIVHIGLKLKDDETRKLQLITVPSIQCESLVAQPISLYLEKFEHRKQFNLADYCNGQDSLQIDALIRADYY